MDIQKWMLEVKPVHIKHSLIAYIKNYNDFVFILDDSAELDWEMMVSFRDTKPTENGACKSANKYFYNGSTWHPVIEPFGEMNCVYCRCNNGRIDCSRLKCRSASEYPCRKPVKIIGQCCPVCPLSADGNYFIFYDFFPGMKNLVISRFIFLIFDWL